MCARPISSRSGSRRWARPIPTSNIISARNSRPSTQTGTEDIESLYASYPLVRTRDNNLWLLADIDERSFEDDVGQTASRENRRDAVGTLGLNGNHHDRLWGGGWDFFSLAVSAGDLDIRTDATRALDATTARTNGGYGKLFFMADRLQTIYGPFSLYGDLRGQLASKNLDISEKMELGGAYGVRAYPEGEGLWRRGLHSDDRGPVSPAQVRAEVSGARPAHRLLRYRRGQTV